MPNQKSSADGRSVSGQPWYYSPIVKEHFFNPKNLLKHGEEKDYAADGIGRVGSPACGDEMAVWIKVNPKKDTIRECKWQTFGCASAIAATSMLSVMVTEKGGMKLDKALQIRPQEIMERLGGLPDRKVHCSVLGDKALRAAINDYFHKTNQPERVVAEGAHFVDPELKITDHDIEQAVLEGARTLEEVQKKLKAGVSRPEIVPAIEQLIRFYKEKYYGN